MPAKAIFVSHAYDDRDLARAFVKEMLYAASGATARDVFFSSGHAGEGVPSGSELMATIRNEVSESTLVIALITPTYLTRSICLAEMHAAWGRVDSNFMPLLLPGVKRDDLEGVLTTMATRYLDENYALTEVHERACKALGKPQDVAACNDAIDDWQVRLKALLPTIQRPPKVTPEAYAQLERRYDKAVGQLQECSGQLRALQDRIDAYAAAPKSPEQEEALRPADTIEAFEALRSSARKSLNVLGNRIVSDLIRARLNGATVPYPNGFDRPDDKTAADDAIDAGYVKYPEGGPLRLVEGDDDIDRAIEAVDDLYDFIMEPQDAAFDAWFRANFGGLPSLLHGRKVWEAVFAR